MKIIVCFVKHPSEIIEIEKDFNCITLKDIIKVTGDKRKVSGWSNV